MIISSHFINKKKKPSTNMMSPVEKNSDGSLKVHIQYGEHYNINNNCIKDEKIEELQIKQELLYIDACRTFERDEKSLYNAMWKENFFAGITNLNEPRGLKYICNECNESFVTKLSILTHSQFHRKTFCIICLLYFENQQEMNKHLTSFHADMIKLTANHIDSPNNVANITAEVTLESDIPCDIRPNIKSTTGRKTAAKNRFPPSRKKSKIETVDLPTTEVTTRIIKSRFGRCITVKMPTY